MPASTRQQSEAEERAATSAALEAAEEQAAQAAAAEQAAQDALGLERLAREEAEKAQAALEKRLAELESGFESSTSMAIRAGNIASSKTFSSGQTSASRLRST